MGERYWTGWKSMCSQCNNSSDIGHTGEERLGRGKKSSKTSENFHLSTLQLHSGLIFLHAQPEPAKVKDVMSQTDIGSQTIPGIREVALLSLRAQRRYSTQEQGRCRIRKKKLFRKQNSGKINLTEPCPHARLLLKQVLIWHVKWELLVLPALGKEKRVNLKKFNSWKIHFWPWYQPGISISGWPVMILAKPYPILKSIMDCIY